MIFIINKQFELGLVTHFSKNNTWELASSFVMSCKQEDCQVNDSKSELPLKTGSLHLPLHGSMCMIFTGHYNGLGVEIRSVDEMTLLYHMGCFGKGSASRSKPKIINNNGSPYILRKRQILKRNYWYKRYEKSEKSVVTDIFFKNIDNVIKNIVNDIKNQTSREVIDLVSSDEENETEENENFNEAMDFDLSEKQNIAVIVPNSDSEDDNYFANMKPNCCINKTILQEKLMLTIEEAFFLQYGLGCLQVVGNNNQHFNIDDCWKVFSDSNCLFAEKYVVYHYFRSKGYIVKPGIKFGGDYLLYREGPSVNHADYIVVINFGEDKFKWVTMLGHVRMATTTAKEIIIAKVVKPAKNNLRLPQDLCEYSVQEFILTRKLPVTIDEAAD